MVHGGTGPVAQGVVRPVVVAPATLIAAQQRQAVRQCRALLAQPSVDPLPQPMNA